MAYGSYSSIAVGALGGEEYDTLAENLGGRVFFAGEHTTKKHPATMHGAFLSGHREVSPLYDVHLQDLVIMKVLRRRPIPCNVQNIPGLQGVRQCLHCTLNEQHLTLHA